MGKNVELSLLKLGRHIRISDSSFSIGEAMARVNNCHSTVVVCCLLDGVHCRCNRSPLLRFEVSPCCRNRSFNILVQTFESSWSTSSKKSTRKAFHHTTNENGSLKLCRVPLLPTSIFGAPKSHEIFSASRPFRSDSK
jgi:hypothetical protein